MLKRQIEINNLNTNLTYICRNIEKLRNYEVWLMFTSSNKGFKDINYTKVKAKYIYNILSKAGDNIRYHISKNDLYDLLNLHIGSNDIFINRICENTIVKEYNDKILSPMDKWEYLTLENAHKVEAIFEKCITGLVFERDHILLKINELKNDNKLLIKTTITIGAMVVMGISILMLNYIIGGNVSNKYMVIYATISNIIRIVSCIIIGLYGYDMINHIKTHNKNIIKDDNEKIYAYRDNKEFLNLVNTVNYTINKKKLVFKTEKIKYYYNINISYNIKTRISTIYVARRSIYILSDNDSLNMTYKEYTKADLKCAWSLGYIIPTRKHLDLLLDHFLSNRNDKYVIAKAIVVEN